MPTLDWIGKKAVVSHHKEVPFRLLKCDRELSVGEPGSGNLLVQGDNLEALKALLPYYAGQVKCIYIDPPYNTGEKGWIYNDHVDSPEIRKWFGKLVGTEGEDLSRHDKWLCMMYPRVALLRQFLRDDGVIFVSMDETEAGNLRLMFEEIFGRANSLGTLVWKRRSSTAMRGTPLSIDHEYVFVYARDVAKVALHGLSKGVEGYPLEDARGHYASTDLTVGMSKEARPNQFYPIVNPRTGKMYEGNPERVWRFFPETMQKVIEAGLIIWPDDVGGNMQRPRFKTYFNPESDKPKPISSWIESTSSNERELSGEEDEFDISILSSGMNQEGGRVLTDIFGTKAFDYPKPVSLVYSLVRAATRDNDIVLDSFGGSGTTGHAVLKLNKQDDGNRRFILVEMDENICRNVTAERLRRVSQGYAKTDATQVEPLGGGFRFCELGPAFFTSDGNIADEIRFNDLAHHVYFTETGEPLPKRASGKSPLIGVHETRAIFLLFNGILADKSPRGGNALTNETLDLLRALCAGKEITERVIYGTSCRLSASRLKRERVTFRQIPYQVKSS